MAKGFFVTATDTGVGKTVVSAMLLRAARMMGHKACGMKPIETGCKREGDILMPFDGLILKEFSSLSEPIENITQYKFEQPVAPWVAARMKGIEIDEMLITRKYRELASRCNAVVVEGIGGLMVPLKEAYYVADLALDIGLPVVIVASPKLGTINHTLLTVDYALRNGLDVAGIIINNVSPSENTLFERTNPDTLEQLAQVPVIGVMPYLKKIDEASFENLVYEKFDMTLIQQHL